MQYPQICIIRLFCYADSFFDQFMVVCLTDCSRELLIKINKICRDKNISFYSADTFGFNGLFFVDLNKHAYRYDKEQLPKLHTVLIS